MAHMTVPVTDSCGQLIAARGRAKIRAPLSVTLDGLRITLNILSNVIR